MGEIINVNSYRSNVKPVNTVGVPEVLIKDGKENRVFVIEKA